MPGPRENLFAAVVAQLEKIRVENGYDSDVGRVYRVDMLFDQIPDGAFPALEVLEPIGGESMAAMDDGGYLCRVSMTVAGLVKAGTADLTSSDRHTLANALLGDAIRALMQDVSFGAKCKESAISAPIVYVDPDRPEAMFNLTLTCIYAYARGDL